MHSKLNRNALRFRPEFAHQSHDGDATYGRCFIHVYTKDGLTWLGHLGVVNGTLSVSHKPDDFLLQLAPRGVNVDDNTYSGRCDFVFVFFFFCSYGIDLRFSMLHAATASLIRENDRCMLKWLDAETDEWMLVCPKRCSKHSACDCDDLFLLLAGAVHPQRSALSVVRWHRPKRKAVVLFRGRPRQATNFSGGVGEDRGGGVNLQHARPLTVSTPRFANAELLCRPQTNRN